MDGWVVLGLIVLGIVIAPIAARGAERRSQKERDLWSGWADERGWGFRENLYGADKAFKHGAFAGQNVGTVRLAWFGNFDGAPVLGFHYFYEVGSGETSSFSSHQVVALRVPGVQFPWLEIKRGADRRNPGIQFEDAAFNDAFTVRSDDSRFAHAVCHPRFIEWLKHAADSVGDGVLDGPVWWENDCILTYRPGNPEIEEIEPQLRFLSAVARQLPQFLLDDLGAPDFQLDDSGATPVTDEHRERVVHYGLE